MSFSSENCIFLHLSVPSAQSAKFVLPIYMERDLEEYVAMVIKEVETFKDESVESHSWLIKFDRLIAMFANLCNFHI